MTKRLTKGESKPTPPPPPLADEFELLLYLRGGDYLYRPGLVWQLHDASERTGYRIRVKSDLVYALAREGTLVSDGPRVYRLAQIP